MPKFWMKFAVICALFLLGLNQEAKAQFAMSSCLSQYDMRVAVRDKKALPLANLMIEARKNTKGEIVKVQLCPENDGSLSYFVLILEAGKNVYWLQFNSQSGKMIK